MSNHTNLFHFSMNGILFSFAIENSLLPSGFNDIYTPPVRYVSISCTRNSDSVPNLILVQRERMIPIPSQYPMHNVPLGSALRCHVPQCQTHLYPPRPSQITHIITYLIRRICMVLHTGVVRRWSPSTPVGGAVSDRQSSVVLCAR